MYIGGYRTEKNNKYSWMMLEKKSRRRDTGWKPLGQIIIVSLIENSRERERACLQYVKLAEQA